MDYYILAYPPHKPANLAGLYPCLMCFRTKESADYFWASYVRAVASTGVWIRASEEDTNAYILAQRLEGEPLVADDLEGSEYTRNAIIPRQP